MLEFKRVIGACTNLSRFRPYVELIFSLLPFRFVMKMVGILLSSQGFGSGARVRTSGELNAARILLGDDATKPMTIFDVGANRGEYTSAILELYPRSRVFAFEPSRETFRLLEAQFASMSQVVKLNYGLGCKARSQLLYKESQYARIASLTPLDVIDHDYTEKVVISTLDEVVSEHGISEIDLLKIDVEGHELDVITGAQNTLTLRKIKCLQFELGGSSIDTNTTLKDIYEMLSQYGYRIYLISRRGVVPLDTYDYQLEQYSTTNFVAELKSKSA